LDDAMGFLDRLLGRPEPSRGQRYPAPSSAGSWNTGDRAQPGQEDADERAIARYRYLLRTAPPETIEQAHAEAFAQLTPEQRRQVLTGLADDLPPSERSAGDDPRSLARMATRAEMRRPGTLERVFGGPRGGLGMGGVGMGGGLGGGMGVGGMIAGTLLASIAGTVIGSSIASAFLDDNDANDDSDVNADDGDGGQGSDGSDAADGSGDEGSVETAGDFGDGGFGSGGFGDSPGGGYGGDFGGGFGGDFGGGDFGGGDF
jgi:hypothetical protein